MKISENKAVPIPENIYRESGNPVKISNTLPASQVINPSRDLTSLVRLLQSRIPLVNGPGRPIPQEALNSLHALLALLESIKPESESLDYMLFSRFLTGWKSSYGHKMEGPSRKALTDLEVYLRNSSGRAVFVSLSGGVENEKKHWRLSVEKKDSGRGRGPGFDEYESCRLDLSTNVLGDCSVLISQRSNDRSCLFSSTIDSGRTILKKSMSLFREQLERHGIDPPVLSVAVDPPGQKTASVSNGEGVDLWG